MSGIQFDIAHLLAGSLVLISFLELYQDRLYALLNVYAAHALVLAASVAWQAFIQDAPHLYVTAAIALVFKAIVIPVALHRMIVRLGIHREIETLEDELAVDFDVQIFNFKQRHSFAFPELLVTFARYHPRL